MSNKMQTYRNQILLTTCTSIYTSFDKKLHLNKYLPHEAQNQEHAKNIIKCKSM